MPVTGRGKVTRVRTIHPTGHPEKYIHIEVVPKVGPQGGHTVAGPVHTVQKVHKKKKEHVSNGPGPKDGQTPNMNPMKPVKHPHEQVHRKKQKMTPSSD